MQAKGQDIRAVLELGRFPGIAVGIRKDKAASYKSPADLKGMKIGVTAPGSSTNMLVNFLLAKAGLTPQDASFIGVGSAASAVAAIRKGELDAISPPRAGAVDAGAVRGHQDRRRYPHGGGHGAPCSAAPTRRRCST